MAAPAASAEFLRVRRRPRTPPRSDELINYRVRGRFYVVDRLFRAAELRLGASKQQVVRIERRAGRAG